MRVPTTGEVLRALGLPYQRVRVWFQSGVLGGEFKQSGRGRARQWSHEDIVALMIARIVIDNAHHTEALQRARSLVDAYRLRKEEGESVDLVLKVPHYARGHHLQPSEGDASYIHSPWRTAEDIGRDLKEKNSPEMMTVVNVEVLEQQASELVDLIRVTEHEQLSLGLEDKVAV